MENKLNTTQMIFLLLGVLLVTLFFVPSPGTGNMDNMARWANAVNDNGIVAGYKIIADYPPLASVILFGVIKVANFLGIWLYTAIKFSIALFLVLTSIIFWLWTRNFILTMLLHLALIYNSVVLGHVDIYFAPFLVLALWALKERKYVAFTCAFSAACLIKYQPLIIAPFLALYILEINSIRDWRQINLRKILLGILLPFFIIIVPVFAIFGVKEILVNSFYIGTHQGYLSANALNLDWIIGHFLHVFAPDLYGPLINGQSTIIRGATEQVGIISQLVFFAVFLVIIVIFFTRQKNFENLVLFSLLGYWGYFTLNTNVHENHLFIGMILAVILCWLNKKYLPTMLTVLLISNLNLIVFNGFDGTDTSFPRVISGVDTALLIAVFNVCAYFYYWGINILTRKKRAELKPGVSQA